MPRFDHVPRDIEDTLASQRVRVLSGVDCITCIAFRISNLTRHGLLTTPYLLELGDTWGA